MVGLARVDGVSHAVVDVEGLRSLEAGHLTYPAHVPHGLRTPQRE